MKVKWPPTRPQLGVAAVAFVVVVGASLAFLTMDSGEDQRLPRPHRVRVAQTPVVLPRVVPAPAPAPAAPPEPGVVRMAQILAAAMPKVVKPPPAKPEVAPAKPEVAPPPPTAFALEQAMSSKERMKRWDAFVVEAAKKYGVPQPWIRAVIMAESAGRTMGDDGKPIVSTAGAMGLMQLMPKAWADMRAAHGLGKDPFDPHDNIMAGTAYLRILKDKYGYPALFAAYNDGPGHLDQRIANAQLLPTETIVYVERITGRLEGRGALVQFTRPNGTPVMIDGGAVTSVRAALPGEYAPGVNTVITVGSVQQGVQENIARAKTMIMVRGGSVNAKAHLVTKVVLSCARAETSPEVGRITCSSGHN